MDDDGGIFFTWAMDVEESTPSAKQFINMLGAAEAAFDRLRTTAIGAAAYSQLSAKRILAEYHAGVEEMIEAERASDPDKS